MNKTKKRDTFSGQLGFILASAGSAVGLGNIWRFPYLAAKDGGGVFLLCYIILALTFGFTLLTTEVAIGRKTGQSPLTAYGSINKHFKGLGIIACIVPVIILPYYCSIGGWVFKYLTMYATGNGVATSTDGYFTGFITAQWQPIIFMLIFLAITSFIVFSGVNKGIERFSKVLMPILLVLIVFIGIYSLTLSYTDEQSVTRTGLQGLSVYLIPDFSGMTLSKFAIIVMDAMGQLFYSISIAMGIMVAYGSYAPKDANMVKSINNIEIFDSGVAILAGLMIIPAVFTFSGTEGMAGGPGLMFVSLPKVFTSMGTIGLFVGAVFFIVVAFAAITSSVSIMEAIISSIIDKFHYTRKKATIITSVYALIMGIVVCLGYNIFYFEITLPNGVIGQILDIMDYVSNNLLMPIVAILTCVLIGWIAKPQIIIDEVSDNGKYPFKRKWLYVPMIKFIAPVLLLILFLQALGITLW